MQTAMEHNSSTEKDVYMIAECKNCQHSECIPFTDGVYCHLNEVISFRVCSDYEGEFKGVKPEPEVHRPGTD